MATLNKGYGLFNGTSGGGGGGTTVTIVSITSSDFSGNDYTSSLFGSSTSCEVFSNSGSVCNFIKAGVMYRYLVDGAASATINGVTVKQTESYTYLPYEKYSNRQKMIDVSYVDATGSDVLINEEN